MAGDGPSSIGCSPVTLSTTVFLNTERHPGAARGHDARDYRLVVQSYDAAGSPLPGDRARPIGSLQRAVTGDELRRGVSVSLVELRQLSAVRPKGQRGPVLLA